MQVSDDKFEEQAARNGTFPNIASFLACFHVLWVKFAAFSVLPPTFCLFFRLFNRSFHKTPLMSCEFCWQVGSSRMEGKSYSR